MLSPASTVLSVDSDDARSGNAGAGGNGGPAVAATPGAGKRSKKVPKNLVKGSGGSSSASTLGEARQVVSLGSSGCEDGQFLHPVGLVVLPGLGLVIREHSNERLQVLLAR